MPRRLPQFEGLHLRVDRAARGSRGGRQSAEVQYDPARTLFVGNLHTELEVRGPGGAGRGGAGRGGQPPTAAQGPTALRAPVAWWLCQCSALHLAHAALTGSLHCMSASGAALPLPLHGPPCPCLCRPHSPVPISARPQRAAPRPQDEELIRAFMDPSLSSELAGGVEAVRIVRDARTSAGKGVGFVLFRTRQACKVRLSGDRRRHPLRTHLRAPCGLSSAGRVSSMLCNAPCGTS